MKKSLIVLFGLALSAILTGCASSPSVENQVKLINYEQCLSAERDKWSISLQGTPSGTIQWMESQWELEDKILFDFFKKTCEKYLP